MKTFASFIFLVTFFGHSYGQKKLEHYFIDSFIIEQGDTILGITKEIKHGIEINRWYIDKLGEVTSWTSSIYSDTLLLRKKYYDFFELDTFIKNISEFNRFGEKSEWISYKKRTKIPEARGELDYDEEGKLIAERLYKYYSAGEEYLYMWDSTFYPTTNLVTHKWKEVEPNLYDNFPRIPCDSIHIRKDKRGRVVFRHWDYTITSYTKNGDILRLHDEKEYLKYRGSSNNLAKRIRISKNQHFIAKWKYHSNGNLKRVEWKELKEEWEFWRTYNKNGVPVEEMRIEKGEVVWHGIYKVRPIQTKD